MKGLWVDGLCKQLKAYRGVQGFRVQGSGLRVGVGVWVKGVKGLGCRGSQGGCQGQVVECSGMPGRRVLVLASVVVTLAGATVRVRLQRELLERGRQRGPTLATRTPSVAAALIAHSARQISFPRGNKTCWRQKLFTSSL
jgi:hypothetical protein